MRKGKTIIGKEILSLEDGARIDKVHDLVLDPSGDRLLALVGSEGGFMSSAKVVPIEQVSSFGRDAVVVANQEALVSANGDQELRAILDKDERIVGKKVFTTTGDDLGSVADIYFEEASGRVVGFEVSGGTFGDFARGTSYLATDEIARIGSDVIYVQPETADTLSSQVGGVQGAIQSAGAKVAAGGEAAGAKVREGREAAAGKLADVRAGAGQSRASSEESLIGRRTGADVETDTGSVIVPKGRRVRPEDLEAARAAGKIPALASAVAAAEAENARADAADRVGAAGDTAASLWDQFTAKISEMTDATGRRMDAQQTKQRLADIEDAVGRPVTKVILDREDNVILNLGDIVTHQAIQRAHESGGLDSLLGSIYRGDVEFTKAEMRAPSGTEAEATVDKASGGAAIVDELETKLEQHQQEREAERDRKRRESDAGRQQRQRERDARAQERATRADERADDRSDDTDEATTTRTREPVASA